jgi:hypothetical protein
MNAMQPVLDLPIAPRLSTLPRGLGVTDVAAASRSAALAFTWSSPGWGRRELARWLVGPYARAVVSAPTPLGVPTRPHPGSARCVGEAEIVDLVASARREVLDALRDAWAWTREPRFIRERLDEGLVVRVRDAQSNLGFAPRDRQGMGLAERVRSLFVADFLTRTSDYATFAVCEDCDGVNFCGGLYHPGCTRAGRRTASRHSEVRELLLPKSPQLAHGYGDGGVVIRLAHGA